MSVTNDEILHIMESIFEFLFNGLLRLFPLIKQYYKTRHRPTSMLCSMSREPSAKKKKKNVLFP